MSAAEYGNHHRIMPNASDESLVAARFVGIGIWSDGTYTHPLLAEQGPHRRSEPERRRCMQERALEFQVILLELKTILELDRVGNVARFVDLSELRFDLGGCFQLVDHLANSGDTLYRFDNRQPLIFVLKLANQSDDAPLYGCGDSCLRAGSGTVQPPIDRFNERLVRGFIVAEHGFYSLEVKG
jgi:hypothetical protein